MNQVTQYKILLLCAALTAVALMLAALLLR